MVSSARYPLHERILYSLYRSSGDHPRQTSGGLGQRSGVGRCVDVCRVIVERSQQKTTTVLSALYLNANSVALAFFEIITEFELPTGQLIGVPTRKSILARAVPL